MKTNRCSHAQRNTARATIETEARFRIDRADYLRQYETVFQRPIDKGYDAVPVGNGDLAVIVWQPSHLTWMLNKCDISGESSQAARLIFETPSPIARRIGRLETRLSLAEATVHIEYMGGELGIKKPADSWDSSTTPPERFGVWRGSYGPLPRPNETDMGTLKASAYVPFNRNALLIDYSEQAQAPHPTTILFERWIQSAWGNQADVHVCDNSLAIIYRLKSGVSYAAVMTFDGFPGASIIKMGALRTALIVPSTAEIQGRLAIAVVTSHESADPLESATQLARNVLAVDPVKLRKRHCSAWNAFWRQSFMDAGHPYANALYHMALYELGITSRGRRPVKFNGALNLWNERDRVWGEGYTIHNQHSVYAPIYAANHIELGENFHDWIVRVRPNAVKTAQRLFGIEGAYYPEYMAHEFTVDEAIKFTGPNREYELAYILSSGTRCALLLWNRYLYTLDETFLRDKAYPVIHDVATFYVNYGKLGPDGRYHLSPSLSWEERPLGQDGHADCAAWRAIFAIAIESANQLNLDNEKAVLWLERLRKAPPYPIQDGIFSVVMRTNGTPEPPNHFQWQLPNLSSVFPYGIVGLSSPMPLRKTAEATFERFRFNADAGHEYLPVIAARLGKAEAWRAALFQYIQFFQEHDQGLFNYYNMFGNKDEDSTNQEGLHPYLEASGIFAASINEMLLQSHDGRIRVFPAVPSHWPARFILRAAGSFMVCSEHRPGIGIPYIQIQPVGGITRPCRVIIPWKAATTVTMQGRNVVFKKKRDTVEFNAKPAAIYTLTPGTTRLSDIPMIEIGFKERYSPARLGTVWYGNREGANSHTSTFPLW